MPALAVAPKSAMDPIFVDCGYHLNLDQLVLLA